MVLDSELLLLTRRSPLPCSYMSAALVLCCALVFRSLFFGEAGPCSCLPFSVLFPALPSKGGRQDLGDSGGGLVTYHSELISLLKLQKYICNACICAYKNNTSLYILKLGNGLADGSTTVALQKASHPLSLLPWCLWAPSRLGSFPLASLGPGRGYLRSPLHPGSTAMHGGDAVGWLWLGQGFLHRPDVAAFALFLRQGLKAFGAPAWSTSALSGQTVPHLVKVSCNVNFSPCT